jgi:Acetyltransferase (GNAT) domain
MRLDGGVVRMAGIGNVVTARHARGRGLVRALLERVVEHLDNDDYALSLLWTHVPGVYSTHGWRPVPQESLIVQFDAATHPGEGAVEQGTEHDVDAALALHEIADAHRTRTLLRGRDEWHTQRWRLDEGDLDFRVVRQTSDSLRGYVRTRIRGGMYTYSSSAPCPATCRSLARCLAPHRARRDACMSRCRPASAQPY